MATNTFSFFGITKFSRESDGIGESESMWSHDQFLIWEKEGWLYRTFAHSPERYEFSPKVPEHLVGKISKISPLGIHMDWGLDNGHGTRFFLVLNETYARSDEIHVQRLSEDTPYYTSALLKGYKAMPRSTRNVYGFHLLQMYTRNHACMRFLSEPDDVDLSVDSSDYWTAFGMPNGTMMVGPQPLVLEELQSVIASPITLSSRVRENIILALIPWRDVPRELRKEGLRIFYTSMRNLSESNARSNSISWAEDNFALANDPMALPWI